jgi:CRISPR-associated protein Csd1
MVVGGTLFVFWSRTPESLQSLLALTETTTENVARLLGAVQRGRMDEGLDVERLYCLSLSGNAARAVVRNYLEVPLPKVQQSLAQWFRDLAIVDDVYAPQQPARSAFPLWMLCAATVRELSDLSPGVPDLMLTAALEGWPLPDHILAACLARLRLEADGRAFSPARMALIRVCLNRHPQRGECSMSERLDPSVRDPGLAYACGRLLALLERCQRLAVKAKASVLQRYYGAASTAPQSVFPLLLRLNRHHLEKLRDTTPGAAYHLEIELEQLLEPFRPGPDGQVGFPPLLSVVDQGRFSLGFYHQRAEYRRQSAERAAKKKTAEAGSSQEE